MLLQNYYWYFPSALPEKICDHIVKYGNEKKENEKFALTGGFDNRDLKKYPLSKEEEEELKKTRNSNVVWMDDKWIYKEILPYVHKANNLANWNFEWNWSESCQFTKYAINQHYEWHCDSNELPYNRPNTPFHNKIRKLSVTVNLCDATEYEGGELEFDFKNVGLQQKSNVKKCTEILPKGSLVVFPSFVWHRVKPVTKGVRYSLVIWNLGYPFK